MGVRRVARILAVTAGFVGVAVLVAACGGSSKTASSASTTPAVSPAVSPSPSAAPNSAVGSAGSGGRNGAAFTAYTACLAQHGVTVPSFSARARPSGSFSRPAGGFSRPPGASRGPGGGGGGFGGFGSPNPSTSAARAACASLLPAGAFGPGTRTISATTFAAFKSCMSDNGVTITSTNPQTAMQGLNRSDAKTAAALKVCQPILGQGAGGSAAPGSGAPSVAPVPAASS
jgi:hypothetical protein